MNTTPRARRGNVKLITIEKFFEGYARRFGTANPEKFDIAYWDHAVPYHMGPYLSRDWFPYGCDPDNGGTLAFNTYDEDAWKKFDAETKTNLPEELKAVCDVEAIWCFFCIANTTTELPDGTTVHIGGKHAHSIYDPDYMVYNDVVVYPPGVSRQEGHTDCAIYGYPEAVFPPAFLRSATSIPELNSILGLGTDEATGEDTALAARGITPIYLFEVGTWKVEKETGGDGPSILSNPFAELDEGDLKVSMSHEREYKYDQAMQIVHKDGQTERVTVELGTVWELNLQNWTWKRPVKEKHTPKTKGTLGKRLGF